MLLRNRQPRLPQLVRQGIFIDLLEEPLPQPVGDDKAAANDPLRQGIQRICVHPQPAPDPIRGSSAVPSSFLPPPACQSAYCARTAATVAPVIRTSSAADVWNTWLGDPAAAQIGSSASRSSSISSIGGAR